MSAENLGARLQRLRQGAGMSQSQLARAAGVPIGTLRNWEQDRRVPLLDTAARVAAALGVSLDALAGEQTLPAVPPVPPPKPRGRPRKGTAAATEGTAGTGQGEGQGAAQEQG